MIEPTKKTHPVTRVGCAGLAIACGYSAYFIALYGSWSAIPVVAMAVGSMALWFMAIAFLLAAIGIVTVSCRMEVQ